MPRKRSVYVFFDEVCQIDIAWIREAGFLKPGIQAKGWRLSWKRSASTVFIDVDTTNRSLRLTCWSGTSQHSYNIGLECRPSNLGKGRVWYFVCPVTGRLCRKLYGIDGRFYSRHAYPSIIYRSQAEPKSDRGFRRYLTLNGTLKTPKALWDYSDRVRFRTHYRGKHTKRYRDYLERSEKVRAICEARSYVNLPLQKSLNRLQDELAAFSRSG